MAALNKEFQNIIDFIKSDDIFYPPYVFFNYENFIRKIVELYYEFEPYRGEYSEIILDMDEPGDYSNVVVELLELLKNNKFIKNYQTEIKKIKNSNTNSSLEITTRLHIKIFPDYDNTNICKFYNVYLSGREVVEPYGDLLQKSKIAEYIIKKSEDFDNLNIILDMKTGRDFRYRNDFDLKHIKILKILENLQDNKIISINNINFETHCITIEINNKEKLKELVIDKNLEIAQKKDNLIKIYISELYGIYKNKSEKFNGYRIRSDSQRFKIILKLNKPKMGAKELGEIINNSSTSFLSKEIKEINENFKHNLDLDSDLIIHFPGGGYGLNYDKYEIIFS